MISIITVCHNSSRALEKYVSSFIEMHHGSAASVEFVFIDNSDDEGVEQHIETLGAAGYPVRLLRVPNRGFGTACNVGARYAKGRTIIFVNPDIQFISSVDELIGLDSGKWGTAVQCDSQGRQCSIDTTPEWKNIIFELMRVHRYIGNIFPLVRSITYPVGSFLFVDRALFERSGGFDERFFLYYEEAELARRLRRIAGNYSVLRKVRILHDGFGSHKSMDRVFAHEARGFLTYSEVTGQPQLVKRKMRLLAILSILSPVAAARRRALFVALSDRRG